VDALHAVGVSSPLLRCGPASLWLCHGRSEGYPSVALVGSCLYTSLRWFMSLTPSSSLHFLHYLHPPFLGLCLFRVFLPACPVFFSPFYRSLVSSPISHCVIGSQYLHNFHVLVPLLIFDGLPSSSGVEFYFFPSTVCLGSSLV
jgi:hypothetical protein